MLTKASECERWVFRHIDLLPKIDVDAGMERRIPALSVEPHKFASRKRARAIDMFVISHVQQVKSGVERLMNNNKIRPMDIEL